MPKEGGFVTLRLVRDLTQKVGLSAEELEKFGVKEEQRDGMTVAVWRTDIDTTAEIELKEKEADIVVDALKKLDEQKKLEQRHFTLFEKFMKKEE
jgi:hypothetical protein